MSWRCTYRGIEWYKLRDPSFKIRDCQTQNHPKTRLETPTNTSEISISGQNFPRPLFLEEPFYSPFICTAYFMKRQRVRTKFCSYTAVIHAVQNCHTWGCQQGTHWGNVHMEPNTLETAYFFIRIGLPSSRNQWIRSRKPHCFETALQRRFEAPFTRIHIKKCGFKIIRIRVDMKEKTKGLHHLKW